MAGTKCLPAQSWSAPYGAGCRLQPWEEVGEGAKGIHDTERAGWELSFQTTEMLQKLEYEGNDNEGQMIRDHQPVQ